MLREIISNGFTEETVIELLALVFIVFCALPIHEFAHAFAGNLLGDETPRLGGRLTINPMAHIDWMGALLLLVVGFGWGKPVSVNMRNFKTKNKKLGMALVAFAGPLSNIIMAFISLLVMFIVVRASGIGLMEGGEFYIYNNAEGTMAYSLVRFLMIASSVNISLAVFNLLPVPPLDGSRLVSLVLPNKYYYKLMMYERYIAIAIMVLAFTNILSVPISFLSEKLMSGLMYLASFPLKI